MESVCCSTAMDSRTRALVLSATALITTCILGYVGYYVRTSNSAVRPASLWHQLLSLPVPEALEPPSPPSPPVQETDLMVKPIVVAVKSKHYLGDHFSNRDIPGCKYQGYPITCKLIDALDKPSPEADALWYHLPTPPSPAAFQKDAPHQLKITMCMESAVYYPELEKTNFMDGFDIEMTYRLCSHVPVPYYFSMERNIHSSDPGFEEPFPWLEKHSAIAFINSNCEARNGRNDIVKQLMDMKRLPVHAHGRCLTTHPHGEDFDKMSVFRQYKFCIAMENSNTQDYVTEKIWDAFEAGCLPIYMGAPNIMAFVPHNKSFIAYQDFASPESLMDFLERLANNQTAYDEYMAWKYLPPAELNPTYTRAHQLYGGKAKGREFQVPNLCRLCELLMEHRLHPRDFKGTNCLHNQTWLGAKDQDMKQVGHKVPET